MDNQALQAIEALKATAPHQLSPLPWSAVTQDGGCDVAGSDGLVVAVGCYTADAAHIAAAVNAAPHLLARVAELEAVKDSLTTEAAALRASLEAARVAVQGLPHLFRHYPNCASLNTYLFRNPPCSPPCNCAAGVVNAAHDAARLALGLEVK